MSKGAKICSCDFGAVVLNAVHSSYPFKLVLGFEAFSDIFGFCHLLYVGVEYLLGLGVDLGAVLVEFALGMKSCEENRALFFVCHKRKCFGKG